MAHSNRQKLRDERGGRTKHQDKKFKNQNRYKSGFNAESRLIELKAWTASLEEERNKKAEIKGPTVIDVKHFSKKESAKKRRFNVIARITAIIEADKSKEEKMPQETLDRLQKELQTLRSRVA